MKFKRQEYTQQNSTGATTPSMNACKNCWEAKKGIYSALPVFLLLRNGIYTQICFKAVCPVCGDIKTYEFEMRLVPGIYKIGPGGKPDFNVHLWSELKALNLSPEAFKQTLIKEPRRQYYSPDEFPVKGVIGHRGEFCEPKQP